MPLRLRAAARAAGLSLLLAGCCPAGSSPDQAAAGDEFTVMTYNVRRFCYDDRDQDGQVDDFKPQAEIDALLDVIQSVKPDVLAVEEMGERPIFERFRAMLAQRGLAYEHAEFLPSAVTNINVAALSRFPIVSRQSISNETYTINDKQVPVQRGFISIDIQPAPDYRFRLMVAHLKSKRFSELGQTEMRRNEARLLNNYVRQYLTADTNLNLLVVGDMNDVYDSAAIRWLIGQDRPWLTDLRPCDMYGDLWTHFFAPRETYERLDYLFISDAMKPEVVTNKCRVVRHPRAVEASDHRPVVGVFKRKDR